MMMTGELCYTIVGRKLGPFWIGWLTNKASGEKTSVKFSGLWTLRREEEKGDVLGFYHTHPGNSCPSECDRKTMSAWVTCFWRDLLCVIKGSSECDTHRFDPLTYDFLFEGAKANNPLYIATYANKLTTKIGRVIFGITP